MSKDIRLMQYFLIIVFAIGVVLLGAQDLYRRYGDGRPSGGAKFLIGDLRGEKFIKGQDARASFRPVEPQATRNRNESAPTQRDELVREDRKKLQNLIDSLAQ